MKKANKLLNRAIFILLIVNSILLVLVTNKANEYRDELEEVYTNYNKDLEYTLDLQRKYSKLLDNKSK